MKQTLINVEVSSDHQIWKTQLNDVKEEIIEFENRLSDVCEHLDKIQIEHFQNQFIIQKKNIDEIKNDILKHDLHVDRDKDVIFGEVTEIEMIYHENIAKKVDTEILIFNSLKNEFLSFISQNN